jgi:hypothetical protein
MPLALTLWEVAVASVCAMGVSLSNDSMAVQMGARA